MVDMCFISHSEDELNGVANGVANGVENLTDDSPGIFV